MPGNGRGQAASTANRTFKALFPTATIIRRRLDDGVAAPALAVPGKYFIAWSKTCGRLSAVDCVTQKLEQILRTTPVDPACLHWVGIAE
jgi:hypothetical protein